MVKIQEILSQTPFDIFDNFPYYKARVTWDLVFQLSIFGPRVNWDENFRIVCGIAHSSNL